MPSRRDEINNTQNVELSKKVRIFAPMDKESYEKQNPFAGEKKPSMKRRCAGHDYTERQMYMVTLTTEGRRPLFGVVTGRSDAPAGHHDAPKVELSQLGQRVVDCWHEIAVRYPEITIVALQMMPDHLHGILFVKRQMQKPLGKVILGFKQGCNKAFRQLVPSAPSVPSTPSVALVPSAPSVPSTPSVALVPSASSVPPTPSVAHVPSAPSVTSTPSVALVPSVAVLQQPTGLTTPSQHADRNHGLLFAPGYNDKLLLRQGQLQRWLHYLQDNPRRLLMKREHPRPLPRAARPHRGHSAVLGHRQPIPTRPPAKDSGTMLTPPYHATDRSRDNPTAGSRPQRCRPCLPQHLTWREKHHARRIQRRPATHHPSGKRLHRPRQARWAAHGRLRPRPAPPARSMGTPQRTPHHHPQPMPLPQRIRPHDL